jgi:uncharacterized protein (TIGR03435 family)
MLQSLLTKRFSLVLHTENRVTFVWTLSINPKKPNLHLKCQAPPVDPTKEHRIHLPRQDLGEETATYTGVPLDVAWQSVGSLSGMKGRIVRETGIEGSYNLSIDRPNGVPSTELIPAARESFARCGFVMEQVQRPVRYLVVTSAGKLIPN